MSEAATITGAVAKAVVDVAPVVGKSTVTGLLVAGLIVLALALIAWGMAKIITKPTAEHFKTMQSVIDAHKEEAKSKDVENKALQKQAMDLAISCTKQVTHLTNEVAACEKDKTAHVAEVRALKSKVMGLELAIDARRNVGA